MSIMTDKIIDVLVVKLKADGVSICAEDNSARLREIEAKLPGRFPASFEALLGRYSFEEFDLGGISWFAWNSSSRDYFDVASALKGSLPEVLLPARYVQIGRPEGGSFDAVCFDMNQRKQNHEYPIVEIDHEETLIRSRIKIRREICGSFYKLVENQVGTRDSPT